MLFLVLSAFLEKIPGRSIGTKGMCTLNFNNYQLDRFAELREFTDLSVYVGILHPTPMPILPIIIS